MSKPVRRRRRSGRSEAIGAAETAKAIQPLYHLPPYELLNEAGVEEVHDKSMQILEHRRDGVLR